MRPEVFPPPRPAWLSRFRSLGTLAGMIGLGLILLANACDAAPITYRYGGTVEEVSVDSGLKIGDRFSGFIRFDPDEPHTNTYTPAGDMFVDKGVTNFGFGNVDGAGVALDPSRVGMTLDVAGRPLLASQGNLDIGITRLRNTYYPNSPSPNSTSITVFAPSREWLANDGLRFDLRLVNGLDTVPVQAADLPIALDLADLTFAGLSVYDSRVDPIPINWGTPPPPTPGRGFRGTIDTFEVVPTPEPATVVILGLGAAGWLIRPRKSRRPA